MTASVWDHVVGQADAVAALRASLAAPVHAYLFVGPAGSTKHDAARAFAALLLTGVDTRTVPVAMARTLGGEMGVDYGLLAAIVTLFLIPIFFVTFLLQNQLLRGVTFGTVRK